jgi:hypothetical protein
LSDEAKREPTAYFVTIRKNTSPFPISSPKSATIAIDQLIQAIEDKNKVKALSLVAKRNGAEYNQDIVLATTLDESAANEIIGLLRSRRYIQKRQFSQETFYLFEVTSPVNLRTSTIRVHEYNPDDGVYSDEGVEF